MADADGLAELRLFIALDPEDHAYVLALTSSIRPPASFVCVTADEDLVANLRAQEPAPDVVVTTLEAADRWLANDPGTSRLPLVVLARDSDPDAYERVFAGRRGRVEYLKKAAVPNVERLKTALRRVAGSGHALSL